MDAQGASSGNLPPGLALRLGLFDATMIVMPDHILIGIGCETGGRPRLPLSSAR